MYSFDDEEEENSPSLFEERALMSNNNDENETKNYPSLRDAFHFATFTDSVYAFFGTLSAFFVGCSIPIFNVIFGEILDNFNKGVDQLQKGVNSVAMIFAIMAGGALIVGTFQVYCWSIFGERQTQRMREAYVRSILSQEIGWFDLNGAAEQSTKVADLCGKVFVRGHPHLIEFSDSRWVWAQDGRFYSKFEPIHCKFCRCLLPLLGTQCKFASAFPSLSSRLLACPPLFTSMYWFFWMAPCHICH
jgi:ABC-type multidrug transport system fused ATPase/permease subunit